MATKKLTAAESAKLSEDNERDFTLKVVSAPTLYEVEITGDGCLLFNRNIAQLGLAAGAKKEAVNEDLSAKERRIWKEKLYWSEDVGCYIPAECMHEALKWTASYYGMKIPGRNRATFTKVFASSIITSMLSVTTRNGDAIDPDNPTHVVAFEKLVKRNGVRIFTIRPMLPNWKATGTITVLDPQISAEVLSTHLQVAGMYNGMGDWRPNYGRFALTKFTKVQ